MATPILFHNARAMTNKFTGYKDEAYKTAYNEWRKMAVDMIPAYAVTTERTLYKAATEAEFAVLKQFGQNIANLTFVELASDRIEIYPEVSWEQSWSTLSYYLQLAGDIPACEDAFTRLKVMGYRPNAWKKAVSENLSKIIYINDSVIGNATYYSQTLQRINASMSDLYETLNLVEPTDAS